MLQTKIIDEYLQRLIFIFLPINCWEHSNIPDTFWTSRVLYDLNSMCHASRSGKFFEDSMRRARSVISGIHMPNAITWALWLLGHVL
jgi:hypothetical protein